ncbi:gliding motility-associated C-terminal domain-containing protein [Gaetbulibacter aestuarii]|uniref:Gliding motility-associated C-terminal domain-containing protein n=1 Tax=Gaetbulibacter aestuarii TaxID=1502358 RepID=A0ABW7MTX8_9FLAO
MKKTPNLIIFITLLVTTAGMAQTTNLGLITVNANTEISVLDHFDNKDSGSFINNGQAYFYGNMTNNGVVDYNTPESSASLVGSAQQIISGSEPFYFHDLIIANNSGLENAINMSGTFHVEHDIAFNSGILNTIDNNGTLILDDNGTVSNTSDFSFVDGFITKLGNDAFTFPIGDNAMYRFAEISAPSGVNSLFNGRYVYKDTDNPYPSNLRIGNIVKVNNREYWVFETPLGTENVDVTLSWNESSTPYTVYSNPDGIRMARWNFEEGAWEDVGGTVDTLNKTITANQTIDGIAVFTIAGADLNIILPDDVIVWNAVSPNNDGKNDYLFIENIDLLPNNSLEIFNRWGAQVFSTTNYDSNGNVFEGFATGKKDTLLPTGTYYYILKYDGTNERVEKAGYLFLSTD